MIDAHFNSQSTQQELRLCVNLFAVFCLALLLLQGTTQAELIVQGTPRWGFDGKARVAEFNLISIDIANDSEQPWEGSFDFRAVQGFQGVGVPIIQPDMFIEGYGKRQLQFMVYLPQIIEFRLKWGRQADQQYKIDEPKISEDAAVVQVVQDGAFSAKIDGVSTFEEMSFPNSAGGLEGLGTVLLDHEPRWNDSQKQAFTDWIRTGGELHLYHETAGTFPEFSGKLADLNVPVDNSTLGSGTIHRHATTLSQATQKFPRAKESSQKYPEWQLTNSLFATLKEMTQPDHNWSLIYLLAILYLLLLFPGCWIIGRKRGDYRVTYGAILGIVVLFSMGFHTVGKRGYGEKTSINSLAIARLTGTDRMIVTQWSNLFITTGGVYEVKHQEEGLVYSTGQTDESVLGAALNRPIGLLQTDIPSFSSRTILHTGVLKSQPLTPQVKELKTSNGKISSIQIDLPAGQTWPETTRVYGIYQNIVYQFSRQNNVITKPSAMSIDVLLSQDKWQIQKNYWNKQKYNVDQLFEQGCAPLIAQDLGLKSDRQRQEFMFPKEKIRIYLYGEMPEIFYAQKDVSSQQAGRVLYTFDIPSENVETEPEDAAQKDTAQE